MTAFRDPPPKRGDKWKPVVRKLKEHPGKWALVLETAPVSIPNAIRKQAITSLRATSGFEIRTSNETREPGVPRTCDVYLRYNPNLDEGLTGHARRTAIADFKKNTGEDDD